MYWRKWDVKWRDSWEGLQIPRQRGGTKPRSWHDIELSPFSPHAPSPTLISLPLFFLFLFFCLFLVALGLHCCTQPFSSCNAQASHGGDFSYCEAQALATWFNNCMWLAGLVAPWHVESSGTRDWTCVPCIGRWIPIHCTTKEVPPLPFFWAF